MPLSFNNSKLSKYFATKKITDFDGLPTEIIPTSNFSADFAGKDNTGCGKMIPYPSNSTVMSW